MSDTAVFGSMFLAAACALPVVAADEPALEEAYGSLPLHFEANRGQTRADVLFLSRGPGYGLFLTAAEAVLALAPPAPDAQRDSPLTDQRTEAPTPRTPVVVRMTLVGAASNPIVTGIDELPGKASYLIGNDQARWATNIPTYAKVHYRDVYPGIDVVYYGNQRQLEYDFIVAPEADPSWITFEFTGADDLEIEADGALVLHTEAGPIRHKRPVIYQDIDGIRHAIAGEYIKQGLHRVGFQIAAYDTSRPLIIDPVVVLDPSRRRRQ